jgi:acyl dehydratase
MVKNYARGSCAPDTIARSKLVLGARWQGLLGCVSFGNKRYATQETATDISSIPNQRTQHAPDAQLPQFDLADIVAQTGQELGVSSWIAVEQSRIDEFAALTGDHQWIHVDAERAAKGPFGATIEHGHLTLALIAATLNEVAAKRLAAATMLNYGIDRLRFTNPVKAGSRVRNRVKLARAEPKGDERSGKQITASAQPGSAAYPPIANAPGTYVVEK